MSEASDAQTPVKESDAVPESGGRGIVNKLRRIVSKDKKTEAPLTPEKLKEAATHLRESIVDNKLNGDIEFESNAEGRYGIPDIARVGLSYSVPESNKDYVRFYVGDEITVAPVDPHDFGMGMDTMSFEWTQYRISPDGKVVKETERYPHSTDKAAQLKGLTHDEGVLVNQKHNTELNDQASFEIIEKLQKDVDNALTLKRVSKPVKSAK